MRNCCARNDGLIPPRARNITSDASRIRKSRSGLPSRSANKGRRTMSTFRRGKVWWFDSASRASASANRPRLEQDVAREAERARRRWLELGINGLKKRERPPLFPVAAKEWFESKTALTPLGRAYYSQYLGKLKGVREPAGFGYYSG